MIKSYYSLGLMSGTSGDGIDASVIQSDGDSEYKVILNKYFRYNRDIFKNIHNLKDRIDNSKDLKTLQKKIKSLEKKITLFHAKITNKIIKETKSNIDFIGFHGQTIFHNSKEKISIQLGDGKLLSKLTDKIVVFNFRKNDLKNSGEGAPLTPIFHKLIAKQNKLKLPTIFLNIGGISNWTYLGKGNLTKNIRSADVGPGNCLIDKWIKKKINKRYDQDGLIAQSGNINKYILEKAIHDHRKKFFYNKEKSIKNLSRKKSYDVKDFNFTFAQGLSLKDGAATLTEFTASIISEVINKIPGGGRVILCGGGRKNKFLFKRISKKSIYKVHLIDKFGIDGDFVESQAFAYLAIRSIRKLPISFPKTSGVRKPCVGGVISRN